MLITSCGDILTTYGLWRELMWVNTMDDGIDTLAIPALGCGESDGGLESTDVHRLINKCFTPWLEPGGVLYGLKLEVFEPQG